MSNINNDNQKELELENNLEELKKKLSVHDYYYDYDDFGNGSEIIDILLILIIIIGHFQCFKTL